MLLEFWIESVTFNSWFYLAVIFNFGDYELGLNEKLLETRL